MISTSCSLPSSNSRRDFVLLPDCILFLRCLSRKVLLSTLVNLVPEWYYYLLDALNLLLSGFLRSIAGFPISFVKAVFWTRMQRVTFSAHVCFIKPHLVVSELSYFLLYLSPSIFTVNINESFSTKFTATALWWQTWNPVFIHFGIMSLYNSATESVILHFVAANSYSYHSTNYLLQSIDHIL
jgi:hypothetical protein